MYSNYRTRAHSGPWICLNSCLGLQLSLRKTEAI